MKIQISVLVPCFNEIKTINAIIEKVIKSLEVYNFEVVIVDDGSSDGSAQEIKNIEKKYKNVLGVYLSANSGKGNAIQEGLKFCKGDIVVFQDADLEYNPNDIHKMIIPFLEANADVVYGSRFLGSNYVRLHYFSHYLANKFLTFAANVFTNLNMTDMETGYKLFKNEVIKSIDINEKSFGVEPEITMKLAKKGFKFFEVPISYNGRSYKEGKKISAIDGVAALLCIVKYRFF
jgi:glycosyltransferase involved in cell wall biosynthesis